MKFAERHRVVLASMLDVPLSSAGLLEAWACSPSHSSFARGPHLNGTSHFASLVIAGARDGKRIKVSGSLTGLGVRAILRPQVKLAGEASYTQGVAQILVSMDGTFTRGRRTGRRPTST